MVELDDVDPVGAPPLPPPLDGFDADEGEPTECDDDECLSAGGCWDELCIELGLLREVEGLGDPGEPMSGEPGECSMSSGPLSSALSPFSSVAT